MRRHYFQGLKPNLHYCYGAMQDKFKKMAKTSKPKIHFHEGGPHSGEFGQVVPSDGRWAVGDGRFDGRVWE